VQRDLHCGAHLGHHAHRSAVVAHSTIVCLDLVGVLSSAGMHKGMLAWVAMVAALAGVSLGVAAATYYSRLAAAVAAAIGRRDASLVRIKHPNAA